MRVTNEQEIQEYLNKTGWQSFEKLVAKIFEENGYSTKTGLILNQGKKTQVDVVAEKYGKTVVVECKKLNTNSPGLMRKEAVKQLERMKQLNAQEGVIVTLREFKEKEISGVRIVPLARLNNYLNHE